MNRLLVFASLLFLALCGRIAFAQTEIQLPSPLVFDYYTNAHCTYNPPAWTAANGFSADGNYVLGISQGYVACGHSGRVGGLFYTRYCMLDTWDLTGALVSVTVVPAGTSCPAKQNWVTWTNPVNSSYTAYTVTNVYYGYIQSQYAVLVTP